MTTNLFGRVAAALLLLSLCLVTSAANAAIRAYVSINGTSNPNCSLAQPCRLLADALTAVFDGGEIWMLDSANYNTDQVTITKSVTILAVPGVMGSILVHPPGATGSDGLVINAPGKDITLRNVYVLSFDSGAIAGIRIKDADKVHIEKSTLHDFMDANGGCVYVDSPGHDMGVWIDETYFRNCRRAVRTVNPTAASGDAGAVVLLNNVRVEGAGVATGPGPVAGVSLQGCGGFSLNHTTITGLDVGIQVDSLVAGCSTSLQVFGSQLTYNSTAINVTNVNANASLGASIIDSLIYNSSDAILVTNTGDNSGIGFEISRSHIKNSGNSAINLSAEGGANGSVVRAALAGSEVVGSGAALINLNVNTAGRIQVAMRESDLRNSGTAIVNTAGTGAGPGRLRVSCIRSSMQRGGTAAVNHGFGVVRLDGCHITDHPNDFVNAGSSNIESLGNNFESNITTLGITPTKINPI